MREHVDIIHLSGFHTPAKARYFFEYTGDNIDELRHATSFSDEQNLPILVIAGGRNSLLAFDEYPGLVIYNNSKGYTFDKKVFESVIPDKGGDSRTRSGIQEDILREASNTSNGSYHNLDPRIKSENDRGGFKQVLLTVHSGHPIWQLAEDLEAKHGIPYWHRFLGLPGSVGGAVFGNAGCFGLEIGPYVEHVDILDMKSGLVLQKSGVELVFQYRWSECKNHPEWFILSATFDLSILREKYFAPEEEPLTWRNRVQPTGYSCGSFFKNPSREQSAGSLIESVGLKGYRHGGAFFSDKHANFLMSDGTAQWTDLVDLVELAQTRVLEQHGIRLEPEVRIVRGHPDGNRDPGKKFIL